MENIVDDDPILPCEICRTNIRLSDYINHMQVCQHRTSILSLLNPMLNTFLLSNNIVNNSIRSGDENEIVNIENMIDTYELNNIIGEMIGTVNHGVTDIEGSFSVVDHVEIEDGEECSICMDSLHNPDVICVKTTCEHLFCKRCITKWLRSSRKCPLCLHEFD